VKAVILAAGEGVRLQPITSTRPKHLIKVGGKPIIEHCLDALKTAGVSEVTIVTHYMGNAIRFHLGEGEKLGLKIKYVEQEAVLGTGNAVSTVETQVDGDFILIYGDLLFDTNALRDLTNLYEAEKPTAAMAVVPVQNPESYGIVEVDNQKNIKRIIEKPAAGEAPSNLANAGLYVLSEEIFHEIKLTKASVRGEWELTDALSAIAKKGKAVLAAHISKDDWVDIGRPWDLLEANIWALHRMKHTVHGTVENGAHLVGPVTVAETARIRSGAYI
jgi:UDP-N-acetylglucosamine diphosphorylase / glucose-1-phosphate thymidylyltransferase / UDP-N-acetylgalactosamine diphosphorylase / glucosamine-1-phosphate N-acetyltransferase / galactosamine-1-phosphate N-acetyltransferase